MNETTSAGCNPVERELGTNEYNIEHKEHHRQCPKCLSDNVSLHIVIFEGKTSSTACCYQCKHQDAADEKEDVEKMIDNWFSA